MEPSPLQNLIDVVGEAAELIGDHIKAQSDKLSEEQLIPWSLAYSQLREASERLQEAIAATRLTGMLAVGGPLHGQVLPKAEGFSTPDPEDPRRILTYKRVLMGFPSGFVASVAAYMGCPTSTKEVQQCGH